MTPATALSRASPECACDHKPNDESDYSANDGDLDHQTDELQNDKNNKGENDGGNDLKRSHGLLLCCPAGISTCVTRERERSPLPANGNSRALLLRLLSWSSGSPEGSSHGRRPIAT